ncbi:MAG: YqgE/AlgH family protein [Crocinitomicaceae bacterium]|nr:YqgE/AlgH family protein [Crocinitomicaceae bacterium]
MLDIAFQNNLSPSKGRILISDPFEGDDFFERSVVYLCEHSQEGSFGFVVNNLVELNLSELNQSFPSINISLSTGGPVDTESLFFLHTLGNELNLSTPISSGISIGGDFKQLYEFITPEHIQNHKIRFFLGYSGWSAGQLEEEIKQNAWVVADIKDAEEIMQIHQPDTWKYFMQKLGKKYKMMTDFPMNPNDN